MRDIPESSSHRGSTGNDVPSKPPRTNIDKELLEFCEDLLNHGRECERHESPNWGLSDNSPYPKRLKSLLLTYIKELCEFEKLATVNPKTQIRNQLRQEILKQAEEDLDGS